MNNTEFIKKYMIYIVLILSRILIYFDINNLIVYIFNIYLFFFLLGFSIVKKMHLDVEIYEIIPISISLSLFMNTILSLFLSTYIYKLVPLFINLSYFIIFIIIDYIFLYKKIGILNYELSDIKKNIINIIITLLPVLFGLLLLDDIIRNPYYLGFDPYVNKPIVNMIIKNQYSPISLLKYRSIEFPGFFYLGAITHINTNITLHNLTKFGGIFFISITLSIIYIIMYQENNRKLSILTPFFYILNPFVVDRFFMTIRENLSMVFLMLLIYFLNKYKHENKNRYLIIISLIISTIISTHPLTAFFSIIILASHYNQFNIKTFSYFIISSLLTSLPMLGILLLWAPWVIISQIYIFLGRSDIPTTFWISKSTILSGWNRVLNLNDFSMEVILLLPVGIYNMMKEKLISNKQPLYFLFPTSITILILYLFYRIGFHFNSIRLAIWISLIFSYVAGIGFIKLFDIIEKYIPTYKLSIKYKEITANPINLNKLIMTILILIFIIFHSVEIININKWSPYNSQQVKAAEWLQSVTYEIEDIIIPSYASGMNDITLIEYTGINNYVKYNNNSFITKIMNVSKYNELISTIIKNYPHKKNAYFFISNRWINQYRKIYDFKLLNLLDDNSEMVYDNQVIIYKIYLQSNNSINLLETPIDLTYNEGPQWYFYDVLNGNFKDVLSLNITIDNKLSSKQFFIMIQDEYNNTSEKYIKQLKEGENNYVFFLTNLGNHINKENVNKIIMCFSWWDQKQLNITINNMEIIS